MGFFHECHAFVDDLLLVLLEDVGVVFASYLLSNPMNGNCSRDSSNTSPTDSRTDVVNPSDVTSTPKPFRCVTRSAKAKRIRFYRNGDQYYKVRAWGFLDFFKVWERIGLIFRRRQPSVSNVSISHAKMTHGVVLSQCC